MPDSRPPSAHSVWITTGARLHLGLLNTVPPFGGVGVMIDRPQTVIHVHPQRHFQCPPDLEDRLLPIAARIQHRAGWPELPACRVDVRERAPAHVGLGSGTQLALAVGEAISRAMNLIIPPDALASAIASRGQRSAVGTHGYCQGGLLFEAGESDGKPPHDPLNPLRGRAEIPPHWRVVVLRPKGDSQPVSGALEQDQFDRLPPADPGVVATLSELAGELVSTAETADFPAFAQRVEQYNRLSGSLFASVQGGDYNGRRVTALIDQLIDAGARGVGQSSWGPGVFAWFESGDQAAKFVRRLPPHAELITVAGGLNRPRRLSS